MKAILEKNEINLINQILADFPIRELNKVQQIMNIIESKIETENTEEVEKPETEES
jgi:protein-tyrosine phosphatase